MNALSDIKSKIEKNKEEKRERLLASAVSYTHLTLPTIA